MTAASGRAYAFIAALLASMAFVGAPLDAQPTGALAVNATVVDSSGAPVPWFPCRTLVLNVTIGDAADAAAAVHGARATGPGTCTASIGGLAPSNVAHLIIAVRPTPHCSARTSPGYTYAYTISPGSSTAAAVQVQFACDAATLSRGFRAAGVSLEAPASPPPERTRAMSHVLGAAGAHPLTRQVALSPARVATLEWHYYDRGGICADDQAYAGLPHNFGLFHDLVTQRTFSSNVAVGVGFDDGTWAGVACGATSSSVWEGWARFDLSSLAQTGGYFGHARLIVGNGVAGYTNRDYTSVAESCLGAVVAATTDYETGQIDGGNQSSSLLRMPGHQARPRGAPPPGILTAGSAEFTAFVDVTPIVRGWLRGTPNHGLLLIEGWLPRSFPHDNESCYQVLTPIRLVVTPEGS